MEEKPWLIIDIAGDRSWSAASHHFSYRHDFPKNEVPTAIVLIQDCNSMGCEYIRFIAFDKTNKTYFAIHPKWPFSVDMKQMLANQIVYFKEDTPFCVSERYADGAFIRILERKVE